MALTLGQARPRNRERTDGPDLGLLAAVLVLGVTALAVVWPALLAPADPIQADPARALIPPGPEALLGTDQLGRDILTRIVHGARYSLLAGLASTALGLVIGVPLGVLTGMLDGVGNEVGLRLIDVLSAFPGILLALVVIAITGPGPVGLVLALGSALVPTFTRLVRAETRRVHRSAYVEQARTMGLGPLRIAWRHVLPNTLRALPAIATIAIAGAILGAASLSFIGLGAQPPSPEWGALLAEGRNHLRTAWWLSVFPGLALAVVAVAINTVGRRLQRRLDRKAPE